MNRSNLIREIQVLDQRLASQKVKFRQSSVRSKQALQQIHPLWLICVGLVSGYLSNQLGLRGAYSVGTMGFKTQPLVRAALHQISSRMGR